MNDKDWQNINEHLKNIEYEKMYKTPLSCVAVDIIDSKRKLIEFGYERWLKILSKFNYGISTIMKNYKTECIKIGEGKIYGIFSSNTKDQINNVIDCCIELNTFKLHLNKQIHNILFNDENNGEIKMQIDYGIGAWFSLENYYLNNDHSNANDTLFVGDAINFANHLASKAKRNGKEPILINQLLLDNITKEYKNNNKNIWDLKEYNQINNEKIFGFGWIFTKYLNWIKNND